ncbi:MAG: TIR domain-containing protein [Methanobacteriaceae archaeon]|jgi:hypothetical protein|nr:TIR domain-containing protein [Methanobacteriaceae archaeon]
MVKNIFISHSWKYEEQYTTVKGWINDSNLDWTNMSVESDNPKDTKTDGELKQLIDNNIRNSTGVIILAGMYTNSSKWIDKEIDIALKYNKPIIGIRPRGNERIPTKISDNTEMINWNSSSLINTIKEHF